VVNNPELVAGVAAFDAVPPDPHRFALLPHDNVQG
jgi:hypothetical protein